MTGIRAGAFDAVVQQFLEAAAVPECWPSALQTFAEACGGTGAAAHAADGVTTLKTVVSDGAARLYDDFVKRWRAPELNSHRSRGLALIQKGWRGALTEHDIFTPEQLARDPFQQEFIVPCGFPSFAGMVLSRMPGMMMSVSIYRTPAQGPYQADEIATINQVVGYLRAATTVALRVGMQTSQRLTDALARASQPVALIRRDGRVAHINAPFNGLLGADLFLRAGHITSWRADADKALTAAIARAIDNAGIHGEALASVVLPRRGGKRPLVAQVIPVVGTAHDLLNTVSAVVTVTDLEPPPLGPSDAMLREVFGLSAAEARLAAAIARGRTLAEISQAEGTSRETVRSQLKAVFSKTDTSRQAELVLLLSRLSDRFDTTHLMRNPHDA